MSAEPFSNHLEKWLASKKPKTLNGLVDSFAEKSFAILFLVLMAIPALPIPTGGLTHIFEIITMLLALELIAGRRKVWLPKKWGNRKLGESTQKKGLPYLINVIRKLERFSRPRLASTIEHTITTRLIGLVVLVFTIFAFGAPPFSGLDTLPSLGVVLMSLAIILEDILLLGVGLIVGSVGVGLVLTIGTVVFKSIF